MDRRRWVVVLQSKKMVARFIIAVATLVFVSQLAQSGTYAAQEASEAETLQEAVRDALEREKQINQSIKDVQRSISATKQSIGNAEQGIVDADSTIAVAKEEIAALDVEIADLEEGLASNLIDGYISSQISPLDPIAVDEENGMSENLAYQRSEYFLDELTDSDFNKIEQYQIAKQNKRVALGNELNAETAKAEYEKQLVAFEQEEEERQEEAKKVKEELRELIAQIEALNDEVELDDDIEELIGPGTKDVNTAAGGTIEVATVKTATGDTIEVRASIATDIQNLLDDAAADGIKFGGWGLRSHQRQIELRIQNCGGNTQYNIYQKRSSSCRPPTARPGSSQHETGLAIDFTQNGSSLNSSSSGFRWLKANAANYGLKNLPSEPWHWSTTGR